MINNVTMSKKTQTLQQDVKKAKELIALNPDSRRYFFFKANERWLDWLWENGLLDDLRKKSDDPSKYSYRMPELEYLMRMAEKKPVEVAQIIKSIEISKSNFNPEVVDRFLWIISSLPAQQIKTLTSKIRDERWVCLMRDFRKSGYEFDKIVKKLNEGKEFKAIIELAQAIFDIKSKKEISKEETRFGMDSPFYVSDINASGIFGALVYINESYVEQALEFLIDVMAKIIKTSESNDSKIFDYADPFYLLDFDFFTAELGTKKSLSYREDMDNFTASIAKLIERTIGDKCDKPNKAKELFKYVNNLPSCSLVWRLRLFALAQCPKVFKKELKESFFRLFGIEKYYEIEGGTEYKKALRVGFSYLSNFDQRDYVKNVLEYFSKKAEQNPDQNWHKRTGWEILSSICNSLEKDELSKCKEFFGKECDEKYEPEPSIGKMRSGMISPRGPVTQEEFGNIPIDNIVHKLKNEWSPEELSKQNTDDDFLNPLNAEGVSDLLRTDISGRLQDYIDNANLFFDRDKLDQHYTYSFLRGVQEAIRGNGVNIGTVNFDNLIVFCTAIKKSGESDSFSGEKRKRDIHDGLLSNWTDVHSVMSDVVQEMVKERDGSVYIDFSKHRDSIFSIINYLLTYPSPAPQDEKIESAIIKTKTPQSDEYLVSDPYTIAINTVRGRAFQTFVLFTYQDGKKFSKEEKIKISPDAKKLYENILKNEQTRALMFMFGHYLPSFYFRDRKWIEGLLSCVFPIEPEKNRLYTAAWEGYVSANLFKELFFNHDIQKLYERSIASTDIEELKQKYFKKPDEGVADHLALAFIYFPEFDFGHNLFKKFWSTSKTESQKEFISFIGHHCLNQDYSGEEWFKKNKVSKKKLTEFWEWAIENAPDSKSLSGFGQWINPYKEVLDDKVVIEEIAETLGKTEGVIDWDYGLLKRLSIFAGKNGDVTLSIIRSYLLDSTNNLNKNRYMPIYLDEIKEAMKIIYRDGNKEIKQKVSDLINILIEKGSTMYWSLKDVIVEA
ncbi:hypothetical protein ACFLZ0_02915 [Patescibacteria group bacterium]